MSPLDFSTAIAFLLPGFVASYALTYVSPRMSFLFTRVIEKNTDASLAVGLLLMALAVGMIISGVRALLLDGLQHVTGVKKKKLDYSEVGDQHKLAAFKEAIQNVYRFAQFHGNMCLAVAMLGVLRWDRMGRLQEDWRIYGLLGGTAAVLFLSHRMLLRDTYDKIAKILSP